jgi:TetR/AcrR family transcriptional repressor of nem operon
MRYDAMHKERTRQRVISEAAGAIRRKGAERVAVSEIMAAAGLTHGGFYAHFTSKDDLGAQAISHMFDAAYANLLARMEGRPPAKGLADYVDGYLAPSHCADLANGCPIAALSGDLHTMPDVARGRFNDGTERLVARVAKLLKMLGAQSADALAWSAIAEMMGALLLARTVSDPRRAAGILRSARATVKTHLGLDRLMSRRA